ITSQGVEDIGEHLFKSSRCAMAHANRGTIIDPDVPRDWRRLSSELPIVRALATKAIEDELGVETRHTVWRKHLYELAGFKKIFGSENVAHMQNGVAPPEQTLEVPDINIRIRGKENYAPLEQLRCEQLACDGNQIHMLFRSLQGDVVFRFSLDFAQERLQFDVFNCMGISDTGTSESADRIHEMKRFFQDYVCNGQLHIVDAGTGELIGRKDAFIPLNMMFDHKSATAGLAEWKSLAETRREHERRFAENMDRDGDGYKVSVAAGSNEG
ncbi:MAG: methylamine utilization protein MauJ, partial [Pseudolabrys sp.]